MKKTLLASSVIAALSVLAGCGGGGDGGSSANSQVTSNGDFFSNYGTFINTIAGSSLTKSIGANSYSPALNSSGCTTRGGATQQNIDYAKSQVTTVGSNYACGPQPSDKSVMQCIYLGQDAGRDRRFKGADFSESIEVFNGLGITNFEMVYGGGLFEYTITSENKTASCPSSIPTVNYQATDFNGQWGVKVIKLVNDIPTTFKEGSITCSGASCGGVVELKNVQYLSSSSSWTANVVDGSLPYDVVKISISPDKQNMSILACPTGVAPVNYPQQCIFISGRK